MVLISFFLSFALVLLHKYICTSLRELLSLSHLNRSTWHRLRLHSVAFKANGAPDSVSFFFFVFLNCSFFACRVEVARKKGYRPRERQYRAARAIFSQKVTIGVPRDRSQRVQRVCVCVYIYVCKIKVKRKWEIKKRNRAVQCILR